MANFCTRCGKALAPGEVCVCFTQTAQAGQTATAEQTNPTGQVPPAWQTPPTNQQSAGQVPPAWQTPHVNQQPAGQTAQSFDLNAAKDTAKTFWESMKNRMGIGDPELNKGDAYEKGKKIIPDCVNANEGEIPIKQYEVATLRNRIIGIPYTTAKGRMQVTNKRVIFRAPGRCLAGRTTLQHEFAIDELAGVEARREYVFNFWDLIIGYIVLLFGGGLITSLIGSICMSGLREGNTIATFLLTFLFGVAGCAPFFLLKKKWLLKLLCLGCSVLPLTTYGALISQIGEYKEDISVFFGAFLSFLGFIVAIIVIFTLFIYAIRPNLVLAIKTKSASDAIDIRRKKAGLFVGNKVEEHTGYTEVLPADDAERCIREIDAMINDIQKLGDFGIEKWKA